jgi:hypothetical protein
VKRNIIVAKNAFSPEYCNNVLEVATKFQIGKINGTGVTNNVDNGEHAPKLRRSTVSWIDNNIDSCDIFHPIYKLTRDVNKNFFSLI